MKKVILSIILALSLTSYAKEYAPSMYEDFFKASSKFNMQNFCANNCDILINTGALGLATWALLPEISALVHQNLLFPGQVGYVIQDKTKFVVPPLMLALIGAGVYGLLSR